MALFDQRLALARQLRAGYTPRVTTLSDVMYGTPQAATRLNPSAQVGGLGELRQFAQTRFADAARQSEALRIAQGEQTKAQSGFRGLVGDVLSNPVAKAALKPLEILDIPRRAIISTLKEATDVDGGSFSDWWDQVKDPSFGFGDVTGDLTGSKWANRAIGFAGDVLLDPTTYMTFGASAVLKKAGISATGAAGRYALAARVLEVTGDAAKAKVAAQKGLAVRKVLTAAEKEALKLERAGVYMFGKHLKARRIPLTEKLGEAAESGMARLRLAATATKVGGALQKGMTPKWLDSERLALLRGEVPDEQFAAKLSTVLARDAYRAAREEGTRVASAAFKKAFDASNIVDNADLRQKLHRFLEGVEQPLTDVEQRAFTAWKSAFDEVYDSIDARLKALVPEGDKYGFGRVERYFPHVVTEQGREWLSSGTRAAKEVLDVLGLDDVGPTTFFNPRRLVKDVKFFDQVLKESDLNVQRLNQIANEGGFVGNFFETDVLTAATRYVNDAGEQMGRIGAMGYLEEKGLLKHIDKRGVSDEEAIKTLQRQMKTAIDKDAAVRTKVVATAQDAAAAIDKHLETTRKSAERLATAGGKEAAKSAAALRAAADDIVATYQTYINASNELLSKQSELLDALDPSLDGALFDSVGKQYEAIAARTEQTTALLREYQEIMPKVEAEAALRVGRLAEITKELKAATKELEIAENNLKEFVEFGNWFATHYDAIVSGADLTADGVIGGMVSTTYLRRMLNDSRTTLEIELGKKSATLGEFKDYLKYQAPLDPTIVKLLGGTKQMSKFKSLTVQQADELIRTGFGANMSTSAAMLGGSVYIAKVLYHFGGIDNVPQYMRASLDEAVEAVSSLRAVAEWETLVATAPKRLHSFNALRAEYGAIADEIQRDADEVADLLKTEDLLFDEIEKLDRQLVNGEGRLAFLESTDQGANGSEAFVIRQRIRDLHNDRYRLELAISDNTRQARDLMDKEYRVVSKAERAGTLDVGELGFTTVRGTGTTLNDHLRDEYLAYGLLDPNLAVGGGKTAGDVVEQLGERIGQRAGRPERIAQQRKSIRFGDVYDEESVAAAIETASKKEAEASFGVGGDLTRPDKMLVAESAAQSTKVNESRRVPFTKEQIKYRKIVDRARDAEEKMKWLGKIRGVKADLKKGTGPATKVPANEVDFKAWVKRQSPERIALLRDDLTAAIAEGRNAQAQLDRLGDPSSVWRVQGMTSREMRYDAIYKLEQFMIAQEVARRYSAVIAQFASYGVIPPERVIDDIMRGVRKRRQPALRGREKAFSDAAVLLRNIGTSFTSGMTPAQIRAEFNKHVDALYETLGDTALEHLGPRVLMTADIDAMRAEIKNLNKNVNATAVDTPERAAALAARKEWYDAKGRVLYKTADPLASNVSVDLVNRYLQTSAKRYNFSTPAKARESLNQIVRGLESEGRMTSRMVNLYRQADDVDYRAMDALIPEEGKRILAPQETPTWKIASYQAAVANLEGILESYKVAKEGNFVNAALSESRAWKQKYTASKEQFQKLLGDIDKAEAKIRLAEADPLYAVGKQEQEEVEFLVSMAHVRGWEISPEEWSTFGIRPDVANDVAGNAQLQNVIDGFTTSGRKVFVSRDVPLARGASGTPEKKFVEITAADQVRYGEKLFISTQSTWREVTKTDMAVALGVGQYVPHPAQAARIEAAAQKVAEIEARITSIETAIESGQASFSLSDRTREIAIREWESYSESIVRGENVPLPESNPLLARQLADLNTQRISLLNERERAIAALNKENSFDAVRRQQYEARLKEAMDKADDSKFRGYKMKIGKDGGIPRTVDVFKIYDDFGKAPIAVGGYKEFRKPAVDIQFTEQEWRSLFVPTITPEVTAANAKRTAAAQKKADRISAEIANTIERRAQLAETLPRPNDPIFGVLDSKLNALRLELGDLQETAALGFTAEQQIAARAKLAEIYKGFKSTYTNGLDDARYQGALRVVSDGGKTDTDPFIVARRADDVRKRFAASPAGRVVAKRNKLADEANATVLRYKRADVQTYIYNVKKTIKAIERNIADTIGSEEYYLKQIQDAITIPIANEARAAAKKVWARRLEKEIANPATAAEELARVRAAKESVLPRVAELEKKRMRLGTLRNDEAVELNRLKKLVASGDDLGDLKTRITARYERDEAAFVNDYVDKALKRELKRSNIDLNNPEASVEAMIKRIKAQIEEVEPLKGTLGGTKEPTLMPERLASLEANVAAAQTKKTGLETEQGTLTSELERIKANKKELTARKNAAERRFNAQQREIVKKDVQALIEHEATQKSALAGMRADAQKAVAGAEKATAAAKNAVEKARLKYDQVAAASGGADKLVAAQQLRDSIDSIESIIATRIAAGGNPSLLYGSLPEGAMADGVLKRVAKAKKYTKGDRKVLEAKVRAGETAAAQLAKGGISDAKRVTLEKAAAAGDAAAETLRAVSMTDAEALQLLGMYNEILTVQNLPEGDPLRKILEKAVAAETEFLASARATEDAMRSLDMGQLFSMKMVDDINEGWKELSSWGLPTMQAPEIVVDMLNNVNRLRSQGVMKELNDLVHRYTRFFKAYATLSPGFHVRNAMSNTLMVYMAGADVGNMRRGLSMYNDWLRASREGVESKWREGLDAEERALFDQALRITDAAGGGATTEMFRGVRVDDPTAGRLTSNAVTRGSQRLGSRVDGSGRFMLAFDSVAKGADFHSGTARVKRYLFDYTDTNRIDDAMRDIVPFWIWMSRNMPMQIINQWQNPKGYALYASLMRNVSENEDDGEIVPSWLKESGAAKISSNWYLAPDTGFNRLQSDVAELADPMRLLSKVNPVLRVPVEVLGNRKLYNAVPFSQKPQEVTGGPAQPLIEALLSLAGQTQQTAGGETVVNPKWNYAIQSLIPTLAQGERLIPATDDYQAKQLGSWLGYFGVPLKQVTPQMRESEYNRRMREMEQMQRAASMLGYTTQ